jgi:hypothetical protein
MLASTNPELDDEENVWWKLIPYLGVGVVLHFFSRILQSWTRREKGQRESYERRMRVFNLEVIVVALIVLTILIVWLSATWMAFEKSLVLTF